MEVVNTQYNGRLHAPHDSAHSHDESARVRELEEEVAVLTEKVMESAGRFANYENEIRRLTLLLNQRRTRETSEDGSVDDNQQPRTPPQRQGLTRFGSFMYPRRPVPNTDRSTAAMSPSAREKELELSLSKEQTLRKTAEEKVTEVNGEIEELSATLFQQANEMVANERRENAKLKERLVVLEKRDLDRKRRLEKLESAQKRIERARALLVPR